MKIINCHRKYPITTNFLDTMLEHSVDIQEGETKLDAYRRGLKELDQIAADLRKEAHPEIAGNLSKEPEDRRIGMEIADIYSCEDLKTLETYKFIAKSNPELQAAYNQQYAKLNITDNGK